MYSSVILCIISPSHKPPPQKKINFQTAGIFSCLYTVVSALFYKFIANMIFSLFTVILFSLDLDRERDSSMVHLMYKFVNMCISEHVVYVTRLPVHNT